MAYAGFYLLVIPVLAIYRFERRDPSNGHSSQWPTTKAAQQLPHRDIQKAQDDGPPKCRREPLDVKPGHKQGRELQHQRVNYDPEDSKREHDERKSEDFQKEA